MLPLQPPYWRARLTATMIQAGLVALACICTFMLYQARLSSYSQAMHEAESLAQVLHDGIDRYVEMADATLRDVNAELQLVELHHLPLEVRDAILTNNAVPTQIFGALVVLDNMGRATFSSQSTPLPGVDLSYRDYFVAHKDHPELGLRLTLLASSLVMGEPRLVLSRRINHVDGSFAGVALETINLSLFEMLFSSAKLDPDDDLLLNTNEGQIVFQRNSGSRFFGFNVDESPVGQSLKASSIGSAEGASVLDGIDRLWVQRQLHSTGLTVVVGRSIRGIYAVWQQQALLIGPAIGGLLVFAFVSGLALRRQLQHRERAEATLRASETMFRLLSEAASDMVSRVDASGQRTYVSPAVSRLFGMSPAEFCATPLLDLVIAGDRLPVKANVAKLMTADTLSEVNEVCVRRADGAERWMEVAARTIIDPLTGKADGYVSSWRDVTDRKAAEQRLIESEERYRLLTESASDIVTRLDLNLRWTYVSPASTTVLGYEPQELVGKFSGRCVHPDDAPLVAERFRRMSEGFFERDVLTNRMRHKAGHYVWIEAKINLMLDLETGKPAGILCVVRDISDRKAAADELVSANRNLERLSRHLARARDAAERANEAKSRFLASVSHELRTPLNGIMGYAELLQIEGGLSETQTTRVDAMRAAGQHLLSMITGVLDLSEIERGRLDLHPTLVDLGAVVSACTDLVRPLAQRKGLALIDGNTDPGAAAQTRFMITTDATRLRQIVLNLLGNAVKFTDVGSVTIRLEAVAHDRVRIEVIDTGPGIKPDQRWRLFQEFDRLNVSASQYVEGAGLGLALSHRLATALGGAIGYADNPGGGSVFWLELPAAQTQSASNAPLSQDAAASEVALPSDGEAGLALRILIVDDVAINRDIAASFLASAGHRPTCAECGEDGVALAAAQDFDVVLMDVRMPDIDGREATRRIRALDGPRAQVPIVALTAQAFADEVAECRRAGMDDHLPKPFSKPALLSTIGRAINESAARTRVCQISLSNPPTTETTTMPHYGDELAVLDEAIFSQTAAYLTAENVSSHVGNLIRRTEALLDGLAASREGVSQSGGDQQVVLVAHSLAGSAGMFGFERLSAVARQFEFLMESGSADLPWMAESLRVAATASLSEMRCRVELSRSAEKLDQAKEELTAPALGL